MTEEEMLIRAREAVGAIYAKRGYYNADRAAGGALDGTDEVAAVLPALRNLDKPVELPRPADEVAAFGAYQKSGGVETWNNRVHSYHYRGILDAVRAGIALAKEGKV